MKLDRNKVLRTRERLGYGIETVAEGSGTAKNTVLRAEHEEDIRPSSARKIAQYLGVEVADLIKEPESPKAPSSSPVAPEQGSEELREMTVIALATLAESLAVGGETLADEIASSEGGFPLTDAGTYVNEAWALEVMHDKEPLAIQHDPRVREAMERFESAERRLRPLINQSFGPKRLKQPDMWGDRQKFVNRRAEAQYQQEAEEGPEEKAAEDGA